MIVITGAAGFIGSCLVAKLNKLQIVDLILVDDFSDIQKHLNIKEKEFHQKIHRADFIDWLRNTSERIDFVLHIGARTDTTLFDVSIFDELNLNYSKALWKICSHKNIPFIYASSAATYGAGDMGYDDNETHIQKLQPLNPYGQSKQDFDVWALKQQQSPKYWIGLKFFNVYGPNEYHKGRMASVVFHSYNQIKETGKVKLFKSHRKEYKDGEQLRDFIYVKDVVDVIMFFMQKKASSGIYNLGSGKARTFKDLINAIYFTLDKKADIEFIDTPIDIRDKYQYFTEAKMTKLIKQGYHKKFYSIEEGISDYIENYLLNNNYY